MSVYAVFALRKNRMKNSLKQESSESVQRKVLVVDDEGPNRRLMEALLVPLGYSVFLAENGEEALAKIDSDAPDLVLLDVMMPGMDGYEVARRIKQGEEGRTIPIVMVTALSDVEDRVQALEAGADDFLTKPVDRTELQARVRSLLKVKAYNDHMRNYQQELEAAVARKTKHLRKAYGRIQDASLETIYRLSKAAEFKDEDTGRHLLRMSHFSAAVARKMGLCETVVQSILYAAPMHDVGKIGIPDRVLLKPGGFDDEEWDIMKQHATIGGKILEGSKTGFIKLGEVIALTHHEKWDGSGYPNGLKGSQIPKVGQIVAIADVFDALTSRRPYKEPFSVEKSIGIIEKGRGTHFNPPVVDAFLSILDEILKIRDRYQETDEGGLGL